MPAESDQSQRSKTIARYAPWLEAYRAAHLAAASSIPVDKVARLIDRMRILLAEDRQLFVFGNGGSASNASHFVTDLGKSASNKLSRRFRVLCLNDNVSWITALGNDFSYDEVFRGQLINYARTGDMVLTFSVSGNSPNCVKAVEWAKANRLFTAGLVGNTGGRLANLCDEAIVIDSKHYGHVEDAEMTVAHMLCYGFIENPGWEHP
jgi:D-sedoheptulose 7-phosphate isomerase